MPGVKHRHKFKREYEPHSKPLPNSKPPPQDDNLRKKRVRDIVEGAKKYFTPTPAGEPVQEPIKPSRSGFKLRKTAKSEYSPSKPKIKHLPQPPANIESSAAPIVPRKTLPPPPIKHKHERPDIDPYDTGHELAGYVGGLVGGLPGSLLASSAAKLMVPDIKQIRSEGATTLDLAHRGMEVIGNQFSSHSNQEESLSRFMGFGTMSSAERMAKWKNLALMGGAGVLANYAAPTVVGAVMNSFGVTGKSLWNPTHWWGSDAQITGERLFGSKTLLGSLKGYFS